MPKNPILPVAAITTGIAIIAESLWAATFVQNPSFELNYNPTFPHYGTIDLWNPMGGTGVNESDGPFHNSSTQIPDQARAAFIQGNGSIRQTVTGLTAGEQYWLQFFFDARNCCGGTINLVVRFNGVQIDRINNVRATPTVPNRNTYYFRNVAFTNDTDTGELVFETEAQGDATLDLDAITIVRRDTNNFTVVNPSFEASGNVATDGQFLAGQNLAGWTIGGSATVGINSSGAPHQDSGVPPDQDNVVFLRGQSSISQELNGLIQGSNYVVSFAVNQPAFGNAHLRVAAGTQVLFDADVTEVDAGMPYAMFSGMFTAEDIAQTLTFEQTTTEDAIVFLDDVHVVGAKRTVLPCLGISPTAAELAPGQTATVTVTVPPELTENQSAIVQFRSPNVSVAELVGAAEDGVLSVFFDFGDTTNTFDIRGVGRGNARIEIVDSAGLCAENDTTVTVLTSFVRNASFESSGVPAGDGYGSIVAWNATGDTGLNSAGGPFNDNGLVPDRRQVAFIQQAGSLSQAIAGLTPGQHYWLQFHYNARGNCCGERTINLSVRFGGAEIRSIANVMPVGAGVSYHFQNIDFVPTNSTGLLEFVTTASGDASLLLDAISIVQRDPGDIVVKNPSFESTGVPSGVGYIMPDSFAGWTVTGNGWGPNLDGVGPFTDNGDAPEQDTVAFLQGPVSLSQTVAGLNVGERYTLLYAVNARNCCDPAPPIITHYSVTLGGEELVNEDIVPVGGANPYVIRGAVFMASSSEGELRFTHAPPAGDRTLLLDNIRICPGDCRPRPRLRATLAQDVTPVIRLSWPMSDSGYILECNTEIDGGTWTEVPWPVQVEGDEFVVIDDTSAVAQKFYRLSLPPPAAGH